MYCSIEEAWPTYNYNNNPISRSNGVENFLNDQIASNSIMNKNDSRPQFVDNGIQHVINRKQYSQSELMPSNYLMEKYDNMNSNLDSKINLNSDVSQNSKNNFRRNSIYENSVPSYTANNSNTYADTYADTNTDIKLYNCRDFIKHLENCEECQMLMHNKFKPNRFEELLTMNPHIKETIVIFLIGLLVLMILNLFYK